MIKKYLSLVLASSLILGFTAKTGAQPLLEESRPDPVVAQAINTFLNPTPPPAVVIEVTESRFDIEQREKREAEERAEKARKLALGQQKAKDSAVAKAKQKNVPKPTPEVKTYAEVLPAPGGCMDWMAQAGIVDKDSAYKLIMRESGCNPNARNKSSNACGIGQQLPCGKWAHQWNDPVGGMIDMQGYVLARYGSWANALAHSYRFDWY